MSLSSNVIICSKCEVEVEGTFSRAYQKKELKHGHSDPGMLCGKCAGARDGTRIAEEIIKGDKR